MPFKSKAQQKFMNMEASKGKMSKTMVDEMNKESAGMNLPDKAPKKAAPKKITSIKQLRSLAKKKGA